MVFENLLGKTIFKIVKIRNEELYFYSEDGNLHILYHQQNCCERVSIDDICGDLDDLLDSPLTMVEVVESQNSNISETWTFYKMATIKGYVTIKWFGVSNGYYSESVDYRCEKIPTSELRDNKITKIIKNE